MTKSVKTVTNIDFAHLKSNDSVAKVFGYPTVQLDSLESEMITPSELPRSLPTILFSAKVYKTVYNCKIKIKSKIWILFHRISDRQKQKKRFLLVL